MTRIHLFGRPHLTRDEQPLTFKAPARALSLLAYVLVHADAPLARDAVAFALWPDDVESDARANLRRHLFYLINDVLPAAAPKLPWIIADKRTICWNADAPAWCDVREFDHLSADAATAADAVALYRGDLLEGFEDEWLQAPRERRRERQVQLLLDLVGVNRAAGAHATAIDYVRRLLAIDPWREDGIRALIELRHAVGDRAGALSTYRDFAARLAAEMGVEPMPETTRVYELVATASAPALRASETAASPAAAEARRIPSSVCNADAVRAVPSFTGRESELALIETALWDRTGQAAIHGLSGVGKSALAREYARRQRERYAAVWWLSAQTETGIIDGLVRLGAEFVPELAKQEDRRSAAESVVANVLAGLERPVLLIFDDLDDERLLRIWSPHAVAQVLVTARHAVLGGDIVPLRLDMLEPQETVWYLRREIARDDFTDADALRLAQTLGNLPLALAHAAAYLKSTANVTTQRYLDRINDHLGRTPRGADYDRAVYATFAAATVRAEEDAPGAAALLSLAACFAADEIPEALFHQSERAYADVVPALAGRALPARALRSAAGDTLDVEDALGALDRFSLLTFAPATRTYTMHRLVREAARIMHGPHAAVWTQSAAAVIDEAFPDGAFEAWPVCQQLVPHALVTLAALPSGTCLPAAARLALRCGQYARKRAAFADAEVLLRRGLAIAEACEAAGTYDNLGEHTEALAALLRDTNRLAEAEPLHRRSVAWSEKTYGPDHPSVAAALNDLAILLQYGNAYAEAEALYRRALAIDEAAFGADDPVVALRLHNLALVLHETNRLDEARPLLERALRIDERVYGPDHPDVASDLGNLGWLFLETGDIGAAEPLLRRALAIREAAYGAQHPAFAHALCDIAVLLHDAGRFADAEALYERALGIYESSYGPAHPVVAACLNNVAESVAGSGRFAQARALYERALASDEATYGPVHANVARDLNNLAGLLTAQGHASEAAPLLRRASDIVNANYAADHPRVRTVRDNEQILQRSGDTPSATAPRWRNIRRSPSRGLR